MRPVEMSNFKEALEIGCLLFDNRPEVVRPDSYDFKYFEDQDIPAPLLGATQDRKTLGIYDVEAMLMQLRIVGCEGESLLVLPAGSGIQFGLPNVREVYSNELAVGRFRGHAILMSCMHGDLPGQNIAVAKNFMFQ